MTLMSASCLLMAQDRSHFIPLTHYSHGVVVDDQGWPYEVCDHGTGDVPVAGEAVTDTDTPTDEEAPAEEDATAEEDAPTEEDALTGGGEVPPPRLN